MSTMTAHRPGAARVGGPPHFQIVQVTPAMAETWLKANDNNRHIREALVKQYADDMTSGRWVFNGEAIQLSVDGKLLNGQHRLKAILRSGTTQRMLVGFDLPDETQLTMDAGAKRTAADGLSLSGYTQGKSVASIAKIIAGEVIDGRYIRFVDARPSNLLIHDMVTADPLIGRSALRAHEKQLRAVLPPSVSGYAWWRFAQIAEHKADEFFERLASLDNLAVGHPILALNRRLTLQRSQRGSLTGGGNSRLRQWELTTYTFNAWNAWRRGEDRDHLKVIRNAEGRILTPLPI